MEGRLGEGDEEVGRRRAFSFYTSDEDSSERSPELISFANEIPLTDETPLFSRVRDSTRSHKRASGIGMKKLFPDMTWAMKFLIGFISFFIWINHYYRDIPAAIETNLQDFLGITYRQYGYINTFFFFPNMITPIFLGWFTARYTPCGAAIIFAAVNGTGYLIFLLGVSSQNRFLVYFSRFMQGLFYENVDLIYYVYALQILPHKVGLVSALMQAALRMGSVSTFVITPWFANHKGIVASIWFGMSFGVLGFLIACIVYFINQIYVDKFWLQRFPHRVQETILASYDPKFPWDPKAIAVFELSFWIYCFGGLFAYATVIPFLFFGAEYFQNQHGYSNSAAGHLILIPEAIIIPFGLFMCTYIDDMSLVYRLDLLMTASAILPICFLLFAFTNFSPIVIMIFLGFSWAIVLLMYFSVLPAYMPYEYQALGTGIAGCLFNVGSTAVPSVIGLLQDNFPTHKYPMTFFILFGMSVCSLLCFIFVRERIMTYRAERSNTWDFVRPLFRGMTYDW